MFLAVVVEVVWSGLPLVVSFWRERVQPHQERTCCFLGLFFIFLKSQNHRKSWVKRDLKDPLVPWSFLKNLKVPTPHKHEELLIRSSNSLHEHPKRNEQWKKIFICWYNTLEGERIKRLRNTDSETVLWLSYSIKFSLPMSTNEQDNGAVPNSLERRGLWSTDTPNPGFGGTLGVRGVSAALSPALQPGHEGRTEGSNPFLWENWDVGSFPLGCVLQSSRPCSHSEQNHSDGWHRCCFLCTSVFPSSRVSPAGSFHPSEPQVFTFSLCQSNPELSLPTKAITITGKC